MWPFSKKNDEPQPEETIEVAETQESETSVPDRGPFDGDSVNFEDFDLSDFSDGALDLGSVKIPMPRPSEVQVEMGPDGPRMVHIVTKVGRVTPVAFASSMSGGLWEESIPEIVSGMRGDGLDASLEDGPWGQEIVGKTEHATIRMIGAEGPRWTLRVTLAAPNDSADDLAVLGREMIARTFVYRGDSPMMAGNVLPVVMPAALVEQVQEAMRQRAEQVAAMAQQQAQPASAPAPEANPAPQGTPDEGSALQQMRDRSAES